VPMIDYDCEQDCIPREQVETALRFLEWCHGDALRRPWSNEAHAHYHAIDILEAAMNDELRPPDKILRMKSETKLIQQSRQARKEGYATATLLNERYGKDETEDAGLLSWLFRYLGRDGS